MVGWFLIIVACNTNFFKIITLDFYNLYGFLLRNIFMGNSLKTTLRSYELTGHFLLADWAKISCLTISEIIHSFLDVSIVSVSKINVRQISAMPQIRPRVWDILVIYSGSLERYCKFRLDMIKLYVVNPEHNVPVLRLSPYDAKWVIVSTTVLILSLTSARRGNASPLSIDSAVKHCAHWSII